MAVGCADEQTCDCHRCEDAADFFIQMNYAFRFESKEKCYKIKSKVEVSWIANLCLKGKRRSTCREKTVKISCRKYYFVKICA